MKKLVSISSLLLLMLILLTSVAEAQSAKARMLAQRKAASALGSTAAHGIKATKTSDVPAFDPTFPPDLTDPITNIRYAQFVAPDAADGNYQIGTVPSSSVYTFDLVTGDIVPAVGNIVPAADGSGLFILIPYPAGGDLTVTASLGSTVMYSETRNYGSVSKLATTTVLNSSLNPSTYGQLSFAATVTALSGTPSGTVTFNDGSTYLGSASLNGGGVATFSYDILPAGTHTITAVYGGDGSFQTSTSPGLIQVVNKGTPHMTWLPPADITYGTLLSGTQLDAIADVGGSFTYTPASGTKLNAGAAQNLHVDFVPADGANYNSTSKTVQLNVLKATVTPTITASDKTYDATNSATIVNRTLTGVVSPDDVTLMGGTATFADKNAGLGKTVTAIGLTLSGTTAGNYQLSSTSAITHANISALALTVSSVATNKVYDGTTTALVTLSDNRLGGDMFTDSYASATFPDKNVGTGKTVTVSGIFISGTDAANYVLASSSASATADISAKALSVTGISANKMYDGNTTATLNTGSATLVGAVSGDAVSLSTSGATATFDTKNVGAGKTVTVSGLTISGADAGNYSFTHPTITADITARSLTVSATATNKVYDGTTTATATLSDDKVSGDVVADSYTTVAFGDKNVGIGKTVTVSGISISGTDAANYTLSSTTANATANITARNLTVTAAAATKIYDGTAVATATLSDNRVAGDAFTDNYASATFADKNVGAGKAVGVSGLSISGTDAGNYVLTSTSASATADISAKALSVTGITANKVYDGTTTATLNTASVTLVGAVSGDAVSLSTSGATATFDTKNVGVGKTVTVAGLTISGADAGNYSFTHPTITADITARPLTVSATAANKVYDGTMTATVTLSDNKVSGDVVSESFTSTAFSDKNAGTGKTVTVSGISISGTDAETTPSAAQRQMQRRTSRRGHSQ